MTEKTATDYFVYFVAIAVLFFYFLPNFLWTVNGAFHIFLNLLFYGGMSYLTCAYLIKSLNKK